jgi:hypothetical protein
MHRTDEENAKRFFKEYVYPNTEEIKILEIGLYIGGFNIRSLNPKNSSYVGVDLSSGPGVDVGVGKIDSHNFIVKNEIIGNTRFIIYKYKADGYFALECINKSKSKIIINKVLSTYNFLNDKKH